MRQIAFSEVGVIVKTLEDVEEVYLMCTTLGIHFADHFDKIRILTQDLSNWFIQCTIGGIRTSLHGAELHLSLIDYPITYSMEAIDFAVACQLINTDHEDELIAHLDKYCKEYK